MVLEKFKELQEFRSSGVQKGESGGVEQGRPRNGVEAQAAVGRKSRIPNLVEADVEPIINPATGQEHRARIALPNGFEYNEAEMGNTVDCRVSAGEKLTFELKNTYARLNAFDWSN